MGAPGRIHPRAPPPVTSAEPEWRSSVRVRPAWDLAERWAQPSPPSPPTVSVTALLELRPAYFQRVHPLPFSPEQQARLADGRELHAELGARLASRPEQREVRVRREGIVGQVDWFEAAPTELKTTGSVPRLEQLATSRPQYIDQLAMYCALTGVDHGTLMIVPASGTPVDAAVSVRLEFDELDEIWAEMRRRAELLRHALATSSSQDLPRCPWFARGCAYRAPAICACTGGEAEVAPVATGRTRRLAPDPGSDAALRAALSAVLAQPAPFPDRFVDLMYPRRAYYRLTGPEVEGGTPTWARSEVRDRLYRRVIEHIEATDPAGQGRAMPIRGGIREPVPRMGGRPYLIKVTRARPRSSPEAMLAEQPQYLLELGLRCQAVGSGTGWLLVGYERPGPGVPDIVPYEVAFDPLEVLTAVAEGRETALRDAVASGRPEGLPPCPRWMFEGCPYRDRCGCGSAPVPPNR